jgi:Rieske Fe-S protein
VLTSGAFVVGQAWIAAQDLVRSRRLAPERARIASMRELPRGSVRVFSYPTEPERCLLIRMQDGAFLAYSQSCTHLSCAVVPRLAEGVLHCPCHDGYFDLKTGKNIAGPPPRPLPRIELAVDGDDVYAVGVDRRTV